MKQENELIFIFILASLMASLCFQVFLFIESYVYYDYFSPSDMFSLLGLMMFLIIGVFFIGFGLVLCMPIYLLFKQKHIALFVVIPLCVLVIGWLMFAPKYYWIVALCLSALIGGLFIKLLENKLTKI